MLLCIAGVEDKEEVDSNEEVVTVCTLWSLSLLGVLAVLFQLACCLSLRMEDRLAIEFKEGSLECITCCSVFVSLLSLLSLLVFIGFVKLLPKDVVPDVFELDCVMDESDI